MSRDNMKYSKKIESFLAEIEPSIKIDSISHKSTAIRKIYESVIHAIEQTQEIKILEKSVLRSIHDKDQYPLSYIFFKCLGELNLMSVIPEISDFRTFVDWHRENIDSIDFDKIHDFMENPTKELDNELIDVYRSIYKTSGHRKILHDALYGNNFVSWDIQHDLESSTLHYTKYIINNKHIVHIFVPVLDGIRSDDTVPDNPDIEIIAMLIDMMENLARIDKGTDGLAVNLTVLFSNQKKNVYPRTKVLCCDNINSGSTYPGKTIVCWRREEFYKVLIHELFHYHGFDFYSSNPYYENLKDMLIIPGINGIDMLNEAYTETSTIIILAIVQYVNNMYLSEKSVPELDRGLVKYVKQFLKKEIMFVLFQIAKILVVFGCDDVDMYINNKISIHQNTSFRSYFIIKMLLLSNIKDTIHMMDQGLTIGNRLIDFGELINKSWTHLVQDEIRLKLINTFIEKVKTTYELDPADVRWIYRTCRMCVNDMIQSN
jgi:hypothetical protein